MFGGLYLGPNRQELTYKILHMKHFIAFHCETMVIIMKNENCMMISLQELLTHMRDWKLMATDDIKKKYVTNNVIYPFGVFLKSVLAFYFGNG